MSQAPRILLLDDDPDDRALVSRALRREFPEAKILQILESEDLEAKLVEDAFDLIITDYDLRWANGLEILRASTHRYPNRPVIMFTATGSEEIAVEAMKNGLTDYVLKSPDHFSRLTSAVRLALERQDQLRAVKEAEQRYRSLFEGLPVGLYRSRPDGRLLDVNPALVRVLRYPDRETLLATTAADLYVESGDRYRWIETLRTEREIRDFETRLRRLDGKSIWIRESTRAVMSVDDSILYYEGSIQDITEAKEAEQARQESEERFRRLSSSAFEGIGIHVDGKIHDSNERMASMFGYQLEEILGMDGMKLVIPKVRQFVFEKIRSGDEKPYEAIGLRKDGSTFPIEIVGKAIPYEGTIARVVAIRDITERKEAMKALHESEEKYSNLFQQSSDAILIYDLEGALLDVNHKAIDLLNRGRSELLSMTIHDLMSKDAAAGTRWTIPVLLQEGSVDFESTFKKPRGEAFSAEVSASLFEVAGRNLVQCSVRDTRERNRLEEQLRQAQKMEAVGRLAGGVAHDFNNLLTVITMYCDLLLGHLDGENTLRDDVQQIKRAGERAAALTRQLLAFSRRQVLRPQVLTLNTVVSDLGKMLRRLIGEHIELRTGLSSDLGYVKADPGQLEQVIMNLVVNARDAMPFGGELAISTSNIDIGAGENTIHPAMKHGSYVLLTISDTGVGMDGETLKHIFEPFFTTKERGKGTGLGLSTVYGIVKQSGGFIFAESEPGRRTIFSVYLPRIEAELSNLEIEPSPLSTQQGTETVLVAEDEGPLRALVGKVLRNNGYTVLEATNGAEALEVIHEYEGPIHLMLTDLVMPGMSGQELTRRISAFTNGMKVLYMSGYSDEAIPQHGSLGPDAPFLEKPFTAEVLAQKVRDMLDGVIPEAEGSP